MKNNKLLMNKIFILSAFLLVSACSKTPPAIPNPTDAPPVSAVPLSFKQKILIENFTFTSCGQCPKADLILDSLIKNNPGKVYGATFHINDIMADSTLNSPTSGLNYFDSLFNTSGTYPSGMVNRVISSPADLSPDLWASTVMSALGRIPSCGVALEASNIVNNTLKLVVHVGFNATLSGDYRIHVFIVENAVQSNSTLYDQMNDFSINGTTPDSLLSLYALDDTIHLYNHKNVMRKVVSAGSFEGTPIPQYLMVKGVDYVLNYDIDVTGIKTGNSSVIVFVDKYAQSSYGHWIENVQSVPIGENKDWN
jgi:Outer membrane protein Omp28